MADTDVRRLERDASLNPNDPETLSKLMNAKTRTGEEIDIYWKILHPASGEFCSGVTESRSGWRGRPLFSYEGKTWTDKTELYKFIQKAIACRNTSLIDKLKTCEVVEYRTLAYERVSLTTMFDQAEVELLHAEKVALEKKLAEKEKLLAQKEKRI